MKTAMQTEIRPTDSTALYKNATTLSQPIFDHEHLQFIHAHNDETVLLGACNLKGRFWNGSTWFYQDCSDFDKSRATANSSSESAVCDAAFLDRDKFVLAEDGGVLRTLQVADASDNGSKELKCVGYACQHDDSILSVSAFHGKTRVVSGGMDRCIKVWDTSNMLAEHSYEGAHRKIISCVDAKPKSDDVFVSAGLDCEAVIWDIRQKSPAQVVSSKAERQLLAAAWSPGDDNVLVVGSVEGSVSLIDVRNPEAFISRSSVLGKSIHRMKFDSKRPQFLAICGDCTELEVLDTTNNFRTVYQDNRHKDFVRGITWFGEDLLSCSWDNTVLRHRIFGPPDDKN